MAGSLTKWTGTTLASTDLNGIHNFILTNMLAYAMDGATTTNQDNLKLDLFGSDTATYASFMIHDSSSGYYKCVDPASNYYLVISATSHTLTNSGDVKVKQMASGKWAVYSTNASFEVGRAKVMEYLFKPSTTTDATTARVMANITGLTAIETGDSRDVGKRVSYAINSGNITSSGGDDRVQYEGTFAAGGSSVSGWSYCNSSGTGSSHSSNYIVDGTTHNNVGGAGGTSNEYGTDTSAEEVNSPASVLLMLRETSSNTMSGTVHCIITHESTISWADISTGAGAVVGTQYDYDFTATGGVPAFTDFGTDDLTCSLVTDSTTITTSENTAIVNALYSLTGSNTLAIAVTFDGGTNTTSVTEKELTEIANTGTSFQVKFTITRAADTETDYVTAYAAYYG